MPAKPPFVIHVNEMAEYPDAVYIGRAVQRRKLKASKWANPYRVGVHGSRGECVDNFRTWITQYDLPLLADLSELTGKPLACWCRRSDEERTQDNMCHGDVLVDLWKEQSDA